MPASDGDVLLALGRERHRSRSDRAAGLELPKRLAALRVQRVEVALVGPAEDQPACRREHASPRGGWQGEVPYLLAGFHVERTHRAPGLLVQPLLASAGVIRARPILD